VTNPRTGASVLVRVTDRGPFCGSRELDLSKAAAREVGILSRGVAPVLIEVL
jgi:rare lipoprotein A